MGKDFAMGRVTSLIRKTQINEDGEITCVEQKEKISIGKEPPFVKIYLDNILYLSDLPTGLNSILMSLLKRMSYAENGQKIYINSAMKREILKELHHIKKDESNEDWDKRVKKMSLKNIDNALASFVKGKILFRPETGLYIFNPELFGKGDWGDIKKIRLKVDYTMDGKTFKAEIEKAENI